MFNLTIDEHGNKRSPDKVVQVRPYTPMQGLLSLVLDYYIHDYSSAHCVASASSPQGAGRQTNMASIHQAKNTSVDHAYCTMVYIKI